MRTCHEVLGGRRRKVSLAELLERSRRKPCQGSQISRGGASSEEKWISRRSMEYLAGVGLGSCQETCILSEETKRTWKFGRDG